MLHRCGHLVGHYHGKGCSHPAKIRVLRHLYQRKSMSQKELLEVMQVKPASLSEILTKLECNEHILRCKDDKDKRKIMISLTSKGEQFYLDSYREHEQFVDAVFASLTDSQKECLGECLEILLDCGNRYLEE